MKQQRVSATEMAFCAQQTRLVKIKAWAIILFGLVFCQTEARFFRSRDSGQYSNLRVIPELSSTAPAINVDNAQNTGFSQNNLRFSTANNHSNHFRNYASHSKHHTQEYRAYEFTHFCTQDFALFFGAQLANGESTEFDILRIYQLYSNTQFLNYITSLPGFKEHILRIDRELQGSKAQIKAILQETGFKEGAAKIFFSACARTINNKHGAQEHEYALRAQAQVQAMHPQKLEHNLYVAAQAPQDLARCVTVWHKKQHGPNGARYQKRLAAMQKLTQDSEQKKSKTKIKRVYTITDRDRELIKELNLRKSDFVQLSGHELQHALHTEFIGIARAISDIRTITVGSITGQDWTELLGAYLYTGMQVNKIGNCAQASKIADFCWTVTVGLSEIAIGIGEGIWQGGKNVAHMVCHPLDTGYGAAQALCMLLVCCGDIIMATGDPDLPIDHEYSTFQRAHNPAQAEYLLNVYDTVVAQAKQATARDIARGVSTMTTEALLTGALCSATAKCVTSISTRVPGALHRVFSCAPETAESFALVDGGHMRFSKGALQALAESEAAEARAVALMRDVGVQGGKVLPSVLNSKELAKKIGEDSEKILSYMKPHLDGLAKNGNKVKNIGDNVFKVAHTFSDKHIKNNILNVSKTVEQTAVECINVIKKADAANLLVEGVNNIHTFVNDIPLEIRLFIEEDTLMYFNGFVGHSARNVKHLVKIEGGAIWKAI